MWTPAPPTSPHRSRRGAWRSAPSRRSGAVDDGEWTTQRLVAYLIRRIEELSRAGLNAVIELNPDVMADAARCDADRARACSARSTASPCCSRTTWARAAPCRPRGAVAMADAHCDRDAFIVTQLCAAGAVILGKTNLSEWANYMTSDSNNGFSALGGQVHNPHGPFDVGGSSSGSGAALAAGFAPLAVGSETAGSIVSPAAQNGVVGIKPSLGLVSRDRIIPISDQMDTAGPMALCGRRRFMLSVMAVRDDRDPAAAMLDGVHGVDFCAGLRDDALAGRRWACRAALPLRDEDEAWLARVAVMEAAGATVVEVDFTPPDIDYRPVMDAGMRMGVNAYLLETGAPVPTLADVVAFNAADPANRAPYGQDILETAVASTMSHDEYLAAAQRNRVLAGNALRHLMQAHRLDLLLSLNNQLTRLYAPAGFPAVCLPLARRASGEPVGLTLVADYGADPALVAWAFAAEQVITAQDPALMTPPRRAPLAAGLGDGA
ncbi:MAG: amidase family protein [Caldilineaceae bacterium]